MSEEWMKRRLCVWHPKSTDEHLLSSNRDYFWMDMETYHISAGTNFNADDIRRIAWDMLDNCERPDRDDVRILVGIEIVHILRMIDIYTDGVDDSLGHGCWYIDGINFTYDKYLPALELRLQRRLSRKKYVKHSLCVDPWIPQYQQEPCYDDSATRKRRKIDEIMDRMSILKTFLKNKENKNMLGKSVDVKKVIYSGPCTIVIWEDGDKTIVRCKDGDTYSKEVGLLMCLAKRVWGKNASGSNFNDYISKVISENEENE